MNIGERARQQRNQGLGQLQASPQAGTTMVDTLTPQKPKQHQGFQQKFGG